MLSPKLSGNKIHTACARSAQRRSVKQVRRIGVHSAASGTLHATLQASIRTLGEACIESARRAMRRNNVVSAKQRKPKSILAPRRGKPATWSEECAYNAKQRRGVIGHAPNVRNACPCDSFQPFPQSALPVKMALRHAMPVARC